MNLESQSSYKSAVDLSLIRQSASCFCRTTVHFSSSTTMAFALVLVVLLGVSSVMAGGYDYQAPAYQQSYDKYYSIEYPEIVCSKTYKLSVYQDYSYGKDYSYNNYAKDPYYVLGYPEYLCGELKKAQEVKYDYKPAYKADYKAY